MVTFWMYHEGLGQLRFTLLPHGDVVVVHAEQKLLLVLGVLRAVDPVLHALSDASLVAHLIMPFAVRRLQGLQLCIVRRSYRLLTRYRPCPVKSWAPAILAWTALTWSGGTIHNSWM